MNSQKRCPWANLNQLMMNYHDTEWGVPVHDDRKHFEFFILDAAQAGLSWNTILQRRNGYREAFAGYDIQSVASFSEAKIQELMQHDTIIRNSMKINSAVVNAKGFLEIQKEFGSFDTYVWSFVGKQSKINSFTSQDQIPVLSPESLALSKDLKKRGFKFVGPVICYAYMQAAGLIQDHLVSCFRYLEIAS